MKQDHRPHHERELVEFLLQLQSYPHKTFEKIVHIETHISHLFLTGDYAYKVKKALQLPFLDFRELSKRRYYCEQEFALNSRYAPEIYLEVLPMFHCNGMLCFEQGEEIVEYCLRMVQFDSSMLFSEMLIRGELLVSHLESFAHVIAAFHRREQVAPHPYGVDWIKMLCNDNVETLSQLIGSHVDREVITNLEEVLHATLASHRDLLQLRSHSALKRLHGDLHLRNICWHAGKALPFDGIEFGDQFAVCDTWCDIAFTIMDLKAQGATEHAHALTNLYLEHTDDYEGLALLPLFLSYRAQVRAKVACLSAHESSHVEDARRYLELATTCFTPQRQKIVAVGGLSGSGKSTLAAQLSRQHGLIHIRSDAVRKHLLGVALLENASIDGYSAAMSERVYKEVRERARRALGTGYAVVVDAVHLELETRSELESLARQLNVPFHGLWCEVSSEEAKRRIVARQHDISDADVNVRLQQEQRQIENLCWHRIDTEGSVATSIAKVESVLSLH